jgi:dTDP-4-amino-4,6-dideoxygalactose transaminase
MFNIITEFENKIAEFYGSPYAVSTDCCTHALELCLLYTNTKEVSIPKNTYLSVPMTAKKLNLKWDWRYEEWQDFYHIGSEIYDAAVLWKRNSYIPGTFMCLSFQYKKHLSLSRGGMILTDSKSAYTDLIKLGYDGRNRNTPWAQQEVTSYGYHYYMTPETAQQGLDKLPDAISSDPRKWSWQDYPDLSNFHVFSKNTNKEIS